MKTRYLLWGVVAYGLVGAMLVAGTAGAAGLSRCQAKLDSCITNWGACTTDLAQAQADLAACLAEPPVVFPGDGVDGPALSYTDHGDGTVTDNNTLLMWEVKDTGSGIHGVGLTFTWSSSGSAADGTAFTVFLDTLNNKCDGDETTACTSNADCAGIGNALCGHAGHRDWRMPNVKELQSIVDYGRRHPAIALSFPGSTAAGNYWSSTTFAGDSSGAWGVGFLNGGVGIGDKFSSPGPGVLTPRPVNRYMRAVRGGR